MISKIYAEVLEEIKRLGGVLLPEEEIVLEEVHQAMLQPKEVKEWKKLPTSTLL